MKFITTLSLCVSAILLGACCGSPEKQHPKEAEKSSSEVAVFEKEELPRAVSGVPYRVQLTVHGADGPRFWALEGLPAWLHVNPETGELDGTPSDSDKGFYNITVTARGLLSSQKQIVSTTLAVESDKLAQAKTQLAQLVKAHEIYTKEHKANPVNAKALATQFATGKIEKDPWGGAWRVAPNRYEQRSRSSENGGSRWTEQVSWAEIRSAGPDGIYDSTDDVFWKAELKR